MVPILILVAPHSKLISSLKPSHLLHVVFCQSAIFLTRRFCHIRHHGLLTYEIVFDVEFVKSFLKI